MRLRRIDVLLNEETGERFDKNDVIKISTKGTYSRGIIGRIEWIEILALTIDKSEQYKNKIEKINYEDIAAIEKM